MASGSEDVGPLTKPIDVCVVSMPAAMLFVKVAVGVVGETESMTTVVAADAGEIHSGRPLIVCVAVIVHDPSTIVPNVQSADPGTEPVSLACQR